MQPPAPANSQEALSSLQTFQAGAKKPEDILAAQQAQFGVPAAQQTVAGLRTAVGNTTKLLNQVAPSVMGRTANSLVTSAQATRQIGNEQAPIAGQLQSQGNNLSTASADEQNATARASEAANLAYQGQQGQLSYLQNVYDTLYKREQDAKLLAEQQRQFNEQQALARSTASAGVGGIMPSFATPSQPQQPDQQAQYKAQAQNDVFSLLHLNDAGIIQKTVDAITKSANNGNAYDKLKLQAIQAIAPQYIRKTPAPAVQKVVGVVQSASKPISLAPVGGGGLPNLLAAR